MRAIGAGFLLTLGLISGAPLAQVTEQQTTVLHLSQTAERNVLRDVLRIELRAEEIGADPLGIQSAINRRIAAALDRRASSIAGLMHLVLLRYRDLRVGNAETGGRPGPRFAAMAAMAAPVAEPGEATIRVTIEAELFLAAPHP